MPMRHTNREFEQELQKIRSLLTEMTWTVQAMLKDAVEAFARGDEDLASRVIDADRRIDRLEMETDEQCLRVLGLHQPLGSDLRFVATMLKAVTDIERLGDLCVSISERTAEGASEPASAPPAHITAMANMARDMVAGATRALLNTDADLARLVIDQDPQMDALYAQAVRSTLTSITEGVARTSRAARVQAIAKYLERIGDHATNLAEMTIFMARGQDVRHGASLMRAARRTRGVLFLCVRNAARSQMAEGWARVLLPSEIMVWSAGSDPADAVDPRAAEVMREAGVDISNNRPKPISDVPLSRADIVISLCIEEVCGNLPGLVKCENWILPDPAAATGEADATLAKYRSVRDELQNRITALAEELAQQSG